MADHASQHACPSRHEGDFAAPDLARFAMAIDHQVDKTVSAVVRDAVRTHRLSRLRGKTHLHPWHTLRTPET